MRNIIKKELEHAENLSPEAMTVVVDALKHRKHDKINEKFKCFVLKNNELISFLTNLEKLKNNLKKTRFQLLFKDEFTLSNSTAVAHWSTIDISVEKGKIEFILVDAANSLPTLFYLFTTIHACCPDALITQLSVRIQADENCAYFALTHAWSLSKITDFHLEAAKCKEKNVGDFETYKDYIEEIIKVNPIIIERLNELNLMNALEKISYIPMHKIPKNFGSLFKNTQLLSDFYNIFSSSSLVCSNGQPVFEYIKKHLVQDSSNLYRPHFQNKALLHKIDKLTNRTLLYLDSLSENEFESIISTRKNYANNLLISQLDSAKPIQELSFFNASKANKPKANIEGLGDISAIKKIRTFIL